MIQVTFKKNQQNHWVSFEILGHANYSEYGSDIVCAAVSALATATVNSLEAIAGYEPILEVDQENGGYLYCETLKDLDDKQHFISQTLLESLHLAIEDICVAYADFVKKRVITDK